MADGIGDGVDCNLVHTKPFKTSTISAPSSSVCARQQDNSRDQGRLPRLSGTSTVSPATNAGHVITADYEDLSLSNSLVNRFSTGSRLPRLSDASISWTPAATGRATGTVDPRGLHLSSPFSGSPSTGLSATDPLSPREFGSPTPSAVTVLSATVSHSPDVSLAGGSVLKGDFEPHPSTSSTHLEDGERMEFGRLTPFLERSLLIQRQLEEFHDYDNLKKMYGDSIDENYGIEIDYRDDPGWLYGDILSTPNEIVSVQGTSTSNVPPISSRQDEVNVSSAGATARNEQSIEKTRFLSEGESRTRYLPVGAREAAGVVDLRGRGETSHSDPSTQSGYYNFSAMTGLPRRVSSSDAERSSGNGSSSQRDKMMFHKFRLNPEYTQTRRPRSEIGKALYDRQTSDSSHTPGSASSSAALLNPQATLPNLNSDTVQGQLSTKQIDKLIRTEYEPVYTAARNDVKFYLVTKNAFPQKTNLLAPLNEVSESYDNVIMAAIETCVKRYGLEHDLRFQKCKIRMGLLVLHDRSNIVNIIKECARKVVIKRFEVSTGKHDTATEEGRRLLAEDCKRVKDNVGLLLENKRYHQKYIDGHYVDYAHIAVEDVVRKVFFRAKGLADLFPSLKNEFHERAVALVTAAIECGLGEYSEHGYIQSLGYDDETFSSSYLRHIQEYGRLEKNPVVKARMENVRKRWALTLWSST